MILNFPGGAGGNWLRKVLLGHKILLRSRNFHYSTADTNRHEVVCLNTHSIDPADFDWLYSGSYYFNFFANVIFKGVLTDQEFYSKSFDQQFLQCVNTARHICRFHSIKHLIFFNFNDLVNDPLRLFSCIEDVKQKYTWPKLTYQDFLIHRHAYFETCVNTSDLFENFNHPLWLAFLLGQLMNKEITPLDFSIRKSENLGLVKTFAELNYHHCELTDHHCFDSSIKMPNFFCN